MPRALVVDDLAVNRYMLESLLRGHGYEVTSASNGAEALEVALRNPPDLAISDILMPVMDGFSLCRAWKQDARLKSIPFVFFTATYTDPKDERFALSLGADRFIIKPMDPDIFVRAIEEVLRQDDRHALGSRASDVSSEAGYFREYNEALVRKLDRKIRQLEDANRALSNEISERKKIEQALRDSEAQLRNVVQQLPMPIAVLGEGDEIVLLNAEFTNVFGYTHEDVPDLATWRSFQLRTGRQPAFDQDWRKELDGALQEGRAVEPHETTITAKDGTVHTVEVHVASLGRMALVLVNDITGRRRLELLRDRFLAAAAHELKTPITTIKGYCQLLLRWAPVANRPSRELVAMTTIDAQCDRIQRRVDEMLAAARYRTGLAPVHAERVDFGELARDVIVRLQSRTESHRVSLERPGPVIVEADPERLDEAVATLLDRMLAALPDGEDVRVRLWTDAGEARLSISGHGRFVPPGQESVYFEPFFDARPGADVRHLPMIELGPYLAKLAIEHQKGRVWLERGVHEDSMFVIALPRGEG
jgi:PAS domain S-box-containing protein